MDEQHLVVVALADYEHLPKLRALPKAASLVAGLFEDLGFPSTLPRLVGRGPWQTVTDAIGRWRITGRRLVVYWAGHGMHANDTYYLLATDTPRTPTNTNAIQASTLGQALGSLDIDEILLVVDACGSGGGASQITRSFESQIATFERPDGSSPGLAVISSARRFRQARELALSNALVKVIRDGPPAGPERGMWGPRDQFISPNALAAAVSEELGRVGQTADFSSHGVYGNFIPNPRYQPGIPDADFEGRRNRDALIPVEVRDHFLLKFRGVEQAADLAWLFSGRYEALARISDWLKNATSGMLVVTGAPGTGKSALLGCVAILSVESYRREAGSAGALIEFPPEALPPPDALSVGIHAKNKSLLDCVGELGDTLGLSPADLVWTSAGDLVSAVEERVRESVEELAKNAKVGIDEFLRQEHYRKDALSHGLGITILVDALDEAVGRDVTTIATDLLRPLAAIPLVRMLVGTRANRGPLGTKGSPLLQALGPNYCIVLGSTALVADGDVKGLLPPDTELYVVPASASAADVENYARRRLRQEESIYREHPERVDELARLVATTSDGVFLAARLLTHALARLPRAFDAQSPEVSQITQQGAMQMFEADLHRFGSDATRVTELLLPLGWAEGNGLPREKIWLALVNALRRNANAYTEADLDWLMDQAGAHLVESGESGQTVFRLYHQSYVEYLSSLRETITAQRGIAYALIHTVESNGIRLWRRASGYIRRHLSAHAVEGGVLSELLNDPAYVVEADPDRLSKVLGKVDYGNYVFARLYWRSLAMLRGSSRGQRAAVLHAIAMRDEPTAAEQIMALTTEQRCAFTTEPPQTTFQRLYGHRSTVMALAFGYVDRQPLLATGGMDNMVRIWDAQLGNQIWAISGHTNVVNKVAFGQRNGSAVILSASHDNTVRVWDASTSSALRTTHAGALAFADIDGRPMMALLNLVEGTVTINDVLEGHVVMAVTPTGVPITVAFGKMGEQVFLVVRYFGGGVDVWADGGHVLSLKGIRSTRIALAEAGDRKILALSDLRIRLWDLDRRAELPSDESLGTASCFAFATLGGVGVLATAGMGAVAVWNLEDMRRVGQLSHETSGAEAMALGEVYGRPVAAIGYGSGLVDVVSLDFASGRPMREGSASNIGAINFGVLQGATVVLEGGLKGEIEIYRVSDGERIARRSMENQDAIVGINQITVGQAEIVVVCGRSGLVRVWQLNDPRCSTQFAVGSRITQASAAVIDKSVVVAVLTEPIKGIRGSSVTRDVPAKLIAFDLVDGSPTTVTSSGAEFSAFSIGEMNGIPTLAVALGQQIQLWNLDGTVRQVVEARGMDFNSIHIEEATTGSVLAVTSDGRVIRWTPAGRGLLHVHSTVLLKNARVTAARMNGDSLLLAATGSAGFSVHVAQPNHVRAR